MDDTLAGYVSTGSRQLHYLRSGSGPKLLIAFHGYGNEAGIFSPFIPFLNKDYTVFSIDLPHHGNSKWEAGIVLERRELTTLVSNLMKETGAAKYSLLGYSLGGRACLSIIEQMPEQADKVLLIASDGLVFNPLYYFVTKNFAGKQLFRRFLGSPERFMRYIEWMKEKKYVNASQYNFAMNYLNTTDSREFLLKVWPDMSKIIPNRRRLKNTIAKYHIRIHIFMGSYDRIIPVKNAESFSKGLESVQLHVLNKGHRVFDNDTMPQMAACLLA